MATLLLLPRISATHVDPLWRTEMKANLNRVVQLVVLLAAVLGFSATTAFCQALLRTPEGAIAQRSSFTLHSSLSPHYSLIQHSFLAPMRASSPVTHTAANDFLRDSEPARHVHGFRFASYKSSPTLEDLFAVKTNDTVFVSQSRVPLFHFLGGRLQIAGFSSTVKMGDVLFGPPAQNAVQSLRLTQQARFSSAHSIDLYGVSVGFRLTPPAEKAGRAAIWSVLQSIREEAESQ